MSKEIKMKEIAPTYLSSGPPGLFLKQLEHLFFFGEKSLSHDYSWCENVIILGRNTFSVFFFWHVFRKFLFMLLYLSMYLYTHPYTYYVSIHHASIYHAFIVLCIITYPSSHPSYIFKDTYKHISLIYIIWWMGVTL